MAIKTKADELYEISKNRSGKRSKDGSYFDKSGLSVKVARALYRAKYIIDLDSYWTNCVIDKQAVYRDLLNGKLWDIHNIGEASIRQICKWLADYVPDAPLTAADEGETKGQTR